jgi:hypothetical protein
MLQLNYLDDAPVAANDRRLAAAFMQVRTGSAALPVNKGTSMQQASMVRVCASLRSCCKHGMLYFFAPFSVHLAVNTNSAITPLQCMSSPNCLLACLRCFLPAAARVGLLLRPQSARPCALRRQQQRSSSVTTLMPW